MLHGLDSGFLSAFIEPLLLQITSIAGEITKKRNELKAVVLGKGVASPARLPLPTCANPDDVDVPPCLHTLSRPSFQTAPLFALRFFKLFVLTDQLQQVYTASGIFDGYTLMGSAVHPSDSGRHVHVYNPAVKILGSGVSVGALFLVTSSSGDIVRQVRGLSAFRGRPRSHVRCSC